MSGAVRSQEVDHSPAEVPITLPVDAHESHQSRPRPAMTLTVPGQDPSTTASTTLFASPDTHSPVEAFPSISRSSSRQEDSMSSSVVVDDERQSRLRMHWEESFQKHSIHKHIGTTDEYDRVGVLLVRWCDELDDLDSKDECEELEKVFKERFNYETTMLELGTRPKPHNELMHKVWSLATEYDTRNQKNLIIIYYTGHGGYHEGKGQFYLAPSKKDHPNSKLAYDAQADWNAIETLLLGAAADVLTIFDTCLAANLTKTIPYLAMGDGIFEHISASGIDKITPKPGAKSFTRALITVLKELTTTGNARFSTNYLVQRLWKLRPHDFIPLTWNRYEADSTHIFLSPVRKDKGKDASPQKQVGRDTARLTLDFVMERTDFSEEEVDELSRQVVVMCDKVSSLNIRRVDWSGFRRRKDPIAQFRNLAEAVRRQQEVVRRLSQASSGEFDPNAPSRDVNRPPQRKSSGADDLDDPMQPESKIRRLSHRRSFSREHQYKRMGVHVRRPS
ncbi:MAG: hypothetical protein Q9162_004663 [Coniocarpon cinnabarinum]